MIDDSWRENDGLVNTVSAMAPVGAPSKAFEKRDIRTGMWNIFPVLTGDHMWLQGGLLKKHDIRKFYLRLLRMMEGLPAVPDEKRELEDNGIVYDLQDVNELELANNLLPWTE